MFRQFTGLTPVEQKTTAQKELDRFRIDYFDSSSCKGTR